MATPVLGRPADHAAQLMMYRSNVRKKLVPQSSASSRSLREGTVKVDFGQLVTRS
jgi:hypothetical protein